MDCKEFNVMLDAYVDSEFDAFTMARMETHVQTCPACQQRLREQMQLRAAIKTAAPYFKAPASLRQSMHAQLRKAGKTPEKSRGLDYLNTWRWPTVSAVVTSVVLFSTSLMLVLNTPSADDLLAREVIGGHVRSLMAEHLTDVRSTDQHTVKPWFIGQLDFAPPVRDFSAQGFVLMGGRLDYVNNRKVAALVYQYRKHAINLFIWPTGGERTANLHEREWQGYTADAWTQAGMQFWAVSDINATELNEFTHLLQSAVVTPPVQ